MKEHANFPHSKSSSRPVPIQYNSCWVNDVSYASEMATFIYATVLQWWYRKNEVQWKPWYLAVDNPESSVNWKMCKTPITFHYSINQQHITPMLRVCLLTIGTFMFFTHTHTHTHARMRQKIQSFVYITEKKRQQGSQYLLELQTTGPNWVIEIFRYIPR